MNAASLKNLSRALCSCVMRSLETVYSALIFKLIGMYFTGKGGQNNIELPLNARNVALRQTFWKMSQLATEVLYMEIIFALGVYY